MSVRELQWHCQGETIRLAIEERGEGTAVLLLPALSSISTRSEMQPLLGELATRHRVVTVDWPGFGDLPRPRLDWSPEMLSSFLDWLLREIVPHPAAIVAAGHAAAYVLHHLAAKPDATQAFVMISPTWRGPFPTMMGGQRPWFARVRAAVDAPGLGHALYALNLSKPVIDMMVTAHVYSDRAWLTPERLPAKLAVAKAPGARHSSVRFVTGALDRFEQRDAFLTLARQLKVPTLLVYGEETPPKSRAEMEALAMVPGMRVVRLPRGKLSVHEEFAAPVAREVLSFLGEEHGATVPPP